MIENNTNFLTFLLNGTAGLFKLGLVVFAVLYFIFTLIVLRQVNLMAQTVVTEGGPVLKAVAILYAGLALGVIVLFIGFL